MPIGTFLTPPRSTFHSDYQKPCARRLREINASAVSGAYPGIDSMDSEPKGVAAMHTAHQADPGSWELFSHDADIGVRGRGASLAQAFENAALAMSAAIVDLSDIRPQETLRVSCEAPDPETLFLDWLNALVFEMSTRGMVFGAFDVAIDGQRLKAEVTGEPVDPARHAPAVEVKGATFTELSVRETDGTWVAQCVIDV